MVFTSLSLFETGARVLVVPVNCVGVMGKGLALEFKERYPRVLAPYQEWCKAGAMPGAAFRGGMSGAQDVIYAATKGDWRDPSKLEWVSTLIEKSIPDLLLPHESVAVPALGCGLGGLPWGQVQALFWQHREKYPLRTWVSLPQK